MRPEDILIVNDGLVLTKLSLLFHDLRSGLVSLQAATSADDGSGRDDTPAHDATAAVTATDYSANTEVKEASYELGSSGRKLEAIPRHG